MNKTLYRVTFDILSIVYLNGFTQLVIFSTISKNKLVWFPDKEAFQFSAGKTNSFFLVF